MPFITFDNYFAWDRYLGVNLFQIVRPGSENSFQNMENRRQYRTWWWLPCETNMAASPFSARDWITKSADVWELLAKITTPVRLILYTTQNYHFHYIKRHTKLYTTLKSAIFEILKMPTTI